VRAPPELAPGHHVLVGALAESPEEALAVGATLALAPQPAPDPASLGPRDVVVAVRAAAVGWVDLLMTSGQYQHAPALPYTPGLESAGVVAWKGPAAGDAIDVGDRVIVDGLLVGPRSLGDHQRWGGFASWVVAPVEALHAVPAPLSFEQAAGLLGAYETAYHALVARGRVRAGETVLVHGASGATGLAAVEVAKLLGARVIATGRSEGKLAVVRDHGADHTVVVADDAGGVRRFRDDVKALTGGQGVDVVYDPVGGEVSLESLRCVRFGARFLVVGWASTPHVARGKGLRGAPNANVLPTNLVMMKGLDVLGCPAVISTLHDPSLRPPRLAAVLRWAAEGAIRPHVSHVFPLGAFRDALRARWRGEVVGGAVVVP
jgi:NADPH2:quinone reductase